MVEMLERDRRTLTAGVLRVAKASATLATAALNEKWAFSLEGVADAEWEKETLWDGNTALGSIRFNLQRTMLAACEQSRGLAELARSSYGYTVSLATLARGVVEALARVDWILSSQTADEFIERHASLEHADLRYPQQHELQMISRGSSPGSKVPVAIYRKSIVDFMDRYSLALPKAGLTDLTTRLLADIYHEAPQLYSGMSAAAHGQGWATGNFFDVDQRSLHRDDQMVIEYCAYATETMVHVSDRLVKAMVPTPASVDRWMNERDHALSQLDLILTRRDQPANSS
jgi:hypothetical protein